MFAINYNLQDKEVDNGRYGRKYPVGHGSPQIPRSLFNATSIESPK